MINYKQKGFTLIELLVVVAIIGVLASIAISSLNEAREKARDSASIATLKQIETALEMYYLDHGEYPRTSNAYGVNNAQNGRVDGPTNHSRSDAIEFVAQMESYITNIDVNELLLGDSNQWGSFYYKSVAANNYQSYGLMINLSTRENAAVQNDGGFHPSTNDRSEHGITAHYPTPGFELGEDPRYCMETYTGLQRNWLGSTTRCAGGN